MNLNSHQRSRYFPGIVAEPMSAANRWRYLIFFDDGFAQYVKPASVRMVCAASSEVWRDVYADSASFIRQYLERYGEKRTLMQAKENQRINTEYQGKWLSARVIGFDGSLVNMQFDNDQRNEWIYLGSTRLWPVYQAEQQKRNQQAVIPVLAKPPESIMAPPPRTSRLASTVAGQQRPAPVPARRNSVATRPPPSQQQRTPPTQQQQRPSPPQRQQTPPPLAKCNSNMARKSTVPLPRHMEPPPKSASASPPLRAAPMPLARPAPARVALPDKRRPVKHMNNSTIYVDSDTMEDVAVKLISYTTKLARKQDPFVPHRCNPKCQSAMPDNMWSYSLVARPMVCGWQRMLRTFSRCSGKFVFYTAPCGRLLRNMSEVHRFLKLSRSKLCVDSFSFDCELQSLTEYVVSKCIIDIKVSGRRSGIRAGTTFV